MGSWFSRLIGLRSVATAEAPEATQAAAEEIQGGNFTARINPDGSKTLLDVPILVEHVPPENKEQYVGREYMERAIVRDVELRRQNKHAARVHIGHTVTPDGKYQKTEGAGFLALKRVGKLFIDGRERDALFADVTIDQAIAYEKVKTRQIPYRSVEFSLNFDKPEIYSLALLESETPFFRMPMTTVGREVIAGAVRRMVGGDSCAVAGYAEKGVQAILFNFAKAGTRMTEETMPEEKNGGDSNGNNDDDNGVPTVKPTTPDQKLDFLVEAMTRLCKRMMRDESAQEEQPSTQEAPGEKTEPGPVQEEKEPEEQKEKSMAQDQNTPAIRTEAGAAGDLKKLMELEVKNDALATRVQKIEAEKSRDLCIRQAEGDLRGAGYVFPEGKIGKVFDEHGEPGVKVYVEAVKAHGTPSPSADRSKDGSALPEASKTELEEFKKEGPEAYERALRYAAEYVPAFNPDVPLAEYVKFRSKADDATRRSDEERVARLKGIR